MTNHLGSTPEYGGSVRELPRTKTELAAQGLALQVSLAPRTGTGRRSTPIVTVTYVQPKADNIREAAEALSALLLEESEPPVTGRRRPRVSARR